VPADGVTAEVGIIRQAAKNLPGKGAGAQAQYAALTPSTGNALQLTTVGHTMMQRVEADPIRGKYLDWRDVIGKARGKAQVTKVAVNRKMLAQMLKVIDSVPGCGRR